MKRFHAIMVASVMAVSIMACGQEAEQSDWAEAEAIGIVETNIMMSLMIIQIQLPLPRRQKQNFRRVKLKALRIDKTRLQSNSSIIKGLHAYRAPAWQ